jgi:SIT family siderophore-iron:H+ symporter-like MFS transporter
VILELKMSKFDDKQFHQPESGSQSDDTSASLIGRKSPGVERIEAIAAHISLWDRVAIFFGVFLIAYAYGLDISVRFSAYQVCQSF